MLKRLSTFVLVAVLCFGCGSPNPTDPDVQSVWDQLPDVLPPFIDAILEDGEVTRAELELAGEAWRGCMIAGGADQVEVTGNPTIDSLTFHFAPGSGQSDEQVLALSDSCQDEYVGWVTSVWEDQLLPQTAAERELMWSVIRCGDLIADAANMRMDVLWLDPHVYGPALIELGTLEPAASRCAADALEAAE